jgi:hypothetical protein
VEGRASKRAGNIDNLVKRGELPYFGFATGPVVLPISSGHPWRQTSVSRNNADSVPDEAVPDQERVATIDGTRVGTLICGELFSRRARQGLTQAGARLIVDVGHLSMSQGVIPAMRAVATQGKCCVAHSHHVKYRGRALHFVDGQGTQLSAKADDAHLVQHGSLWAEWAARQV